MVFFRIIVYLILGDISGYTSIKCFLASQFGISSWWHYLIGKVNIHPIMDYA